MAATRSIQAMEEGNQDQREELFVCANQKQCASLKDELTRAILDNEDGPIHRTSALLQAVVLRSMS